MKNHKPYRRGYYRPVKPKYQANQPKPQFEACPLFVKLCEREFLLEVWQEFRRGRTVAARQFRGATDRVSIDLYERHLERNLARLRYELRTNRYRPAPINYFRLPKPDGGQRVLAVATVKDRLVQKAIQKLIEPLFEPEFLACSFAFRPARSVEMALAAVNEYYRAGFVYAADCDIEAFFDHIDRGLLLKLLAAKIEDKKLLALIKLSLTGVVEPLAPSPPQLRVIKPDAVSEPDEGKLARFTKMFLEGGLDWGISQLNGNSPAYSRSYSRYDLWDDDELEEETAPESRGYFDKKLLRRLSADGALLGLTVAKGAIKHGLVPGKLGLVLKIGAAIGAAGTTGAVAYRQWRKRQPTTGIAGLVVEEYTPIGKRGIAQGSILSPLFSNIYLHEFDRKITARGLKLVRFADDMVIMCKSEREAYAALEVAEQILASLGLRFKPAKTKVIKVEKGFKFLGAEWGKDGFAVGNASPLIKSKAKLPVPKLDWLKHSSRVKPGVIQKGAPTKPLKREEWDDDDHALSN